MSPSRCGLGESKEYKYGYLVDVRGRERLGAHGHVTVQGMCMCMCMEGDMCGGHVREL